MNLFTKKELINLLFTEQIFLTKNQKERLIKIVQYRHISAIENSLKKAIGKHIKIERIGAKYQIIY